jgi:hypothetical protein
MGIFSGFVGPWKACNYKMLDAIVDFPAENRPSHPASYLVDSAEPVRSHPSPSVSGRVNDPAYHETRLSNAYNHQKPYIILDEYRDRLQEMQ